MAYPEDKKRMKVFIRSHHFKDEIGFDLALISKFVTKKKKFAVNEKIL
jgi:hypothetical protein